MPPGSVDGGLFAPEKGFLRCEKRIGDQAKRLSSGSAIGRFRFDRASSCGTEGQRRERDQRSAQGLS